MSLRRGLASILILGVGLSTGELPATALASDVPAISAPSSPDGPKQSPSRSAAGDLVASDPVSAHTLARLMGERVEVVGSRTMQSSTYALPDGTFATAQAAGPIWVRAGGDGSHDADWQAVDLDLVAGGDGIVRPKVHPGGLSLAGARKAASGRLASVHAPGSADGVWLDWSGDLPAPSLAGPRATYVDVAPGVDLVIEATRTGFEQFFVIKTRPAKGVSPTLRLTLGADGAAKLVSTPEGGASAAGRDGKVFASIGTPMAWDAAVDGERTHPVTQPWIPETDKGGLARALGPQPALPKQPQGSLVPQVADRSRLPETASGTSSTSPTTAEPSPAPSLMERQTPSNDSHGAKPGRATDPAAKAAKASPLLTLPRALRLTDTAPAQIDVTLDAAFLDDPATAYPVVIDPSANFALGFDTWVQKTYSTDQSGSTELKLGTYNGGGDIARSFINLNMSTLSGKHILGATLSLWETWSYSCSPATWEVWNTLPASTSTRWTAQPAWINVQALSSQTKGWSTSCDDGWVAADTTGIIRGWANGSYGDVAFGLKAQDEANNIATIKRWADGGLTKVKNLAVLCKTCHVQIHRRRRLFRHGKRSLRA